MPPVKKQDAPDTDVTFDDDVHDNENEKVDTDISGMNGAKVDAILRDPNCPADVRATVAALDGVARYLDSVEFTEGDDGYLTVRHVEPETPSDDA